MSHRAARVIVLQQGYADEVQEVATMLRALELQVREAALYKYAYNCCR